MSVNPAPPPSFAFSLTHKLVKLLNGSGKFSVSGQEQGFSNLSTAIEGAPYNETDGLLYHVRPFFDNAQEGDVVVLGIDVKNNQTQVSEVFIEAECTIKYGKSILCKYTIALNGVSETNEIAFTNVASLFEYSALTPNDGLVGVITPLWDSLSYGESILATITIV